MAGFQVSINGRFWVSPEAVNGGDVGMVQAGENLGFPLKPRKTIRISGKRLGQGLERHLAVQLRVSRPIDLPMPPSPILAVTL